MSKLVELVDIVTNFYTYEGTVKALNRVSLTIEHGSSFGLVGESGCGKSVTARSIMRVVQEPGRIESGSVSAAMMVARQSRRNQNTTRIASTAPSNRFSIAAS